MSINQNRSKPVIATTPYDKELRDLSSKINQTYLAYGPGGQERKLKQEAQDSNAAKAAPSSAAQRSATKAGDLYRNDSWDLVDKMKYDKNFDLSKIPEKDLPEELKKLKPAERQAFLDKKKKERDEIAQKIQELATKRAKFVEAELKKLPKSNEEKALDEALKSMIRVQAEARGMKFNEEPKEKSQDKKPGNEKPVK